MKNSLENGLRKNAIDVVITTTTLEAGMNLPIKSVIFFDPKYFTGKRWEILQTRKYKNIAGRAGRPGFHKKGEVIVLATSEQELSDYKKHFWYDDVEPIRSSFNYLLKNDPTAVSAFQSQILGFLSSYNEPNFDMIMNYIKAGWFWKQSQSPESEFKIIEIGKRTIDTLEDLGFITKNENNFEITSLGKIVNESMLAPHSASNIVSCLEYLFTTELDTKTMLNFILILACIPIEIRDNDRIIKNISIPEPISKLKQTFLEIVDLRIDTISLDYALKYASLLYYWINSEPTNTILELCGINESSVEAFIEEGIVKQSYWIFSTIIQISEYLESKKPEVIEEIKKVSQYCDKGTLDPVILELLQGDIKYIGRNSAIKLVTNLRKWKKKFSDMNKEEFVNMFPKNKKTAELLFKELKEKEDLFLFMEDF